MVILGKILVIFAFLLALFSLLYLVIPFGPRRIDIGRKSLHLLSGLLLLSFLLLLYLILSHRFDVAYVYYNSSRDLPFLYLISSSWAGQEGSLLLFALFLSLVGAIVSLRLKEKDRLIGALIALPIFAILSLLMVSSPFSSLGQNPRDGEGLNPLLLNFWMAIHPPFLFLGYSLLLAPSPIILGGIWGGDKGWARRALLWTISGWTVLWIGIATGGYWAYQTLGWGGYWAWDPVENTSLVVWLLSTALIHGLIQQMAGRGMERTNAILSILITFSIFFGSYLTRSGVLGNISVHSFIEFGKAFNFLLLLWTFLIPAVGIIVLLLRWKGCWERKGLEEGWRSRSSYFPAGVWIMVASAFLIASGTIYPLISGTEKVLSQNFFNMTCLPAAVAISILSGIASVLPWKGGKKGHLIQIASSGLLALISIPILALVGVHKAGWIFLMASLIFCISTNVTSIYSTISKGIGPIGIGGYLSHIGISMILIGSIASYGYERKEVVSLPIDRIVHVMGYDVGYKGMDRRGWGIEIGRGKGKNKEYLEIRSTRKGSANLPLILSSFSRDLYISLSDFVPDPNALSLYLKKGEEKRIDGYRIRFLGFEISGMMGSRGAEVRAKLHVEGPGGSRGDIAPGMDFSGMPTGRETIPGNGAVELAKIRADEGIICLKIYGLGGRKRSEMIIVEVSEKPLVSMVWTGTIMMLVGGTLAFVRRMKGSSRS